MAIKFNPILRTLLVVVTIFLLHVSATQGGGRKEVISGGWRKTIGLWKPITNTTDPKVVEIGNFAVDEHNEEEKTKLKFQEVVKGEYQVVHGLNYRLLISAKDGNSLHNYLADVWVKPGGKSRTLTSFEDCGSYPLNITNSVVIALGQFVVDEHNKEVKTKLEFREVIKGYVRPHYTILYYELIVYAKGNDSLHYYLTYLQREIIGSKPLVLTSFEECDSGNESNVRCNL
ncbi:hypothetical protein H5410_059012 [Solanum commersonii]|uniref:Cystatin domain-containing protein n=1 Tax=Solanum commersonii TaxID=4109 RepID=A0A9J5W261_SOLCO|nr:hypothetical protein H5410_059012 [Solanum commersonii]